MDVPLRVNLARIVAGGVCFSFDLLLGMSLFSCINFIQDYKSCKRKIQFCLIEKQNSKSLLFERKGHYDGKVLSSAN